MSTVKVEQKYNQEVKKKFLFILIPFYFATITFAVNRYRMQCVFG